MAVRSSINGGNLEAVRQFYDAFNANDLEGFVEVLDEDVELHGLKALRRGHDEARQWAARTPGGNLHQRIVVEGLRVSGDRVVALIRQQWLWADTDQVADDVEVAAVFDLQAGKIVRWQPFEQRDEALAAAGLE